MRLADLTLHDCPLLALTLDAARAQLRLRIAQFHEVRQAYDEYELVFDGLRQFSCTPEAVIDDGEREIYDYQEQAGPAGYKYSFTLLTGFGRLSQVLRFSCATYHVAPVPTP